MVHIPYQIRFLVQRLGLITLLQLTFKIAKAFFHCCVDCQVPFLGQRVFVDPVHSAEVIFFNSAAFAGSCRALVVALRR